jgi:hypothetical protein
VAYIKVVRRDGCDGIVKVSYECEDNTDPAHESAEKFTHYLAKGGELVFLHGETEQTIEIPIV